MIYIILFLMFALILSIEYFMFKLEKRVSKLSDRIFEIELDRSKELLKPKEEPKAEPKLTKEEKDKQERMKNAFDNLMNYDETIARKIRK